MYRRCVPFGHDETADWLVSSRYRKPLSPLLSRHACQQFTFGYFRTLPQGSEELSPD